MTGARTYGSLRMDDGRWVLEEIEPHVSIRLKQLFPMIQRTAAPPYTIRATDLAATDLEWFMQRYPLRMGDADRAALVGGRLRFDDGIAERERILRPDYRPPTRPGFRPGKALRDYQAQAVEILASRGSLLCGDEVGLGKTVVAAGAMLLPGALPAAVVVEPHVQKQWADKIREFTDLRVHLIKDTKGRSLPPADVYVWRYSNLGGWADIVADMEFGLAVWDEIQRLRKGTATQMGQASVRLRDAAARRLGLTATPIYNYGSEIWNVLRFIDPLALGDAPDFNREWAPGGRIADPKALGYYLREQHAFIRRTRKDVGRELPAVNRIVETIDYDEDTVRSVEDLARQLAIKAVTADWNDRGQAARELDVMVRHATGVAKAKQVAHYVRILLEAGEAVMLVGWHRDVYDIWLRELADHNPVMYTGSETAAAKDRAKEAVLAGESRLLILSLRSGAGLDGLQERFDIVVFGELDWSPGIHHQVIGRLDRDRNGEQRQVTAIFLVTEEGSDPPMMDVLGLKSSESTQIVDPALGVQQTLSDGSAVQRLVQRYLDRQGRKPAPRAPAPSKPEGLNIFDLPDKEPAHAV